MGICAEELRNHVIRPTLEGLGTWNTNAEELLLATAAQESCMGFHILSESTYGVYQITAATHVEVWDQYLVNRPDMASRVRGLASQHMFLENPHRELTTNLLYATAIAWFVYERSGQSVPERQDVQAMAKFWQQHFHQEGDLESFAVNYQMFVDLTHLAA